MIFQDKLIIQSEGRKTSEITNDVNRIIEKSGTRTGLCNIYIQHTSASLMLCENADPDVRSDMETFMQHIVPDGASMFKHVTEGPDDMPAHIRTLLTDTSINIPIQENHCALGTWQGIYVWEHRYQSHQRKVIITVYGE